jgi:hypothetical protein
MFVEYMNFKLFIRMVTNRISLVAQKVISATQTVMSYTGKRRARLF